MDNLDKNVLGLIFGYLEFDDLSRCRMVSMHFNKVAITSMGGETPYQIRTHIQQLFQQQAEIKLKIAKFKTKLAVFDHFMETAKFARWFWTKLINALNVKISHGEYDSPIKINPSVKEYREGIQQHVHAYAHHLILQNASFPKETDTICRPIEIDIESTLQKVSNLNFQVGFQDTLTTIEIYFSAHNEGMDLTDPNYSRRYSGSMYVIDYHINNETGHHGWSGWNNVTLWDFLIKDSPLSELKYYPYASNDISTQHILELVIHETFYDTLVPMLRNIGYFIPPIFGSPIDDLDHFNYYHTKLLHPGYGYF